MNMNGLLRPGRGGLNAPDSECKAFGRLPTRHVHTLTHSKKKAHTGHAQYRRWGRMYGEHIGELNAMFG